MSDYIKRENAKRAVWGCSRDTGIDEAPFEYAEGLLEDVPSEDVVPVVRCKDCKGSEVFQNDSSGVMARYCNALRLVRMVADDDYCSYGERRE